MRQEQIAYKEIRQQCGGQEADTELLGARELHVSPSTESWQQHDILLRNRFYRITCPLPGAEAAHHDTGVKAILAEDVRHTGAGGLAQSGAIEVNLLLL